VWNDTYVPFTGANTTEDVSAELYGHTDALNYDNYDRIDGVEAGNTYYIVAFNAPVEGEPTSPQCSDGEDNDGDGFVDKTDPACFVDDVYDPELDDESDDPTEPTQCSDGIDNDDEEDSLADANDPACHTDGDADNDDSYDPTIDDETDEPVATQCSDGEDNDGDTFTDIDDPTCYRDEVYDPTLDNEENQKPVISLTGGSVELFVGDSYTDEGATADDVEDGNGLTVTDISGSIDVNTPGDYTVFYNFSDSEGLPADEVTRTVTVKEEGGGGGTVLSSGGGGGGGGGGPIQPSLRISNEAVTSSVSGLAVVTWNTNLPASSQVFYDTGSHLVVGPSPDYGYANSSTEITALTTEHIVIIAGINSGEQNYFRPISKSSTLKAIGIELALLPGVQAISAPTQCTYLEDYLRLGDDNDPAEVTKLQSFLRDFEGFTNIELTGIFDQATFDAVSAFQAKYADDVLAPWGITSPTGFVYLTTQKKINEIHCGKTLPLTESQIAEINSFRASIGENQEDNDWYKQIDLDALDKGALKTENILPTINNSEKDEEAYEQDSMQAAVGETKTGWVRSIFNKFKNLFK